MDRRPLFWFTIAFAFGILLTDSLTVLPFFFAFVLPVCLFFFAARKGAFWLQAAILLFALLLGGLRYRIAQIVPPNSISRLAPVFGKVTGTVVSDPDLRGLTGEDNKPRAAFVLSATRIESGTQIFDVSGLVQISLPLDTEAPEPKIPRYSETVTLTGRLDFPADLRNPNGFDYQTLLQHKGIATVLTVRRPQDWRIDEETNGNPLLSLAFRLRQRILQQSRDTLPPERAAVLNGILLGSRADLPISLHDAFERTGTSHILATAGLHVGIFTGLLFGLLRLFSVGRRPSVIVCVLALIVFVIMAGGRPSVTRAAFVASLFLLGFILEREPDWWTITAFAALCLLLQNPLLLFDSGFQLSFVTVITLVLLMPFFAPFLARFQPHFRDPFFVRVRKLILEYFAACFAVSLAAQIAVLPLLAYYQYRIPIISVFANATVVPLIAPIFALGFCCFALSLAHPALAVPFVSLLNYFLVLLIALVRWWDALPLGAFNIPPPPVPVLWIWYASFWLMLWRLKNKPRRDEPQDEPDEEAK